MNCPETLRRVTAALENPMAYVKLALAESTDTSFEVAQATGMAASTIRAVRNGARSELHADNWAKLARWALEREGVRLPE